MTYQGTFPSFERLCEVFARVMEQAEDNNVSIQIVPHQKSEVCKDEKKHIRN